MLRNGIGIRSACVVAAVVWLGGLHASVTAAENSSQEIMVPMRDEVKLATNLFLPEGDGPWPAIVTRTPYGKDARFGNAGKAYTDLGYAFLAQDQRGRFRSEGVYTPHENEMNDGYDTIEWIAAQPWCNGKVGITGASAMGIAANMAAAADPPHLVAAFVRVAPESLFYEGRFIGGLFKEADTGNWMRNQGVSEDEITNYRQRVILDDRWRATDLIFHRQNIDIPIYNYGGWYDLFCSGNIENFLFLQNQGREGARGNQKLLMGPFGHGVVRGDVEYPGTTTLAGSAEIEMRWFDHWLQGKDNGIMDEPAVTYYMMAGARKGSPSAKNQWQKTATWPPEGSRGMKLYLRKGLGLEMEPPMQDAASTSYKFDPANPAPTVGGLNLTLPLGPMDQREIGQRQDYLRFQTEPLTSDLRLAGPMELELWAATDGPDTDFMAKVVDVYPDGYEALVLDTGLRTRYRFGREAADVRMMTPNEPEKLNIDLWHTAITIEKGHRLALHITSSNSPRFEVNPNTGEAPGESKLAPRVATNTIYHDMNHPSVLRLTVLADGQ